MIQTWGVLTALYGVVVTAVAVLAIVLLVLLCRLVLAARENLQTSTRLRELQIERMLLEDE
ncbi:MULTISPECIES: hypothetical protein [unclassified Rathayibacter]|uniref:hypothetical protein n=1 Tax=unclassified Rathayibacter TaxID=2609250 RepID=UPI000CE92A39|nr:MULTISPECIES: hypothetical protein [unclassified Rathayibacter]PPF53339.1 hypothetical protein C5C55_13945 [Rathayibacter sp. AY1C2]PPG60373.1 hypothetical protein C5C69_09305 [Rathayibacter sp. AY1C7]PPH53587.1 hypothetical protein C5C67_08215 [Rathayibacter sp. AY1E1]PPH87765.1 hypothetical protein C5C82_09495 [Rathayibacter sp. AY1D5]PPI06913.1 hypothetical protein C5C63_08620 [Rathayibacter sp. AY1B8]